MLRDGPFDLMLHSRIYRRVAFHPLSDDDVLELIPGYHPIFAGARYLGAPPSQGGDRGINGGSTPQRVAGNQGRFLGAPAALRSWGQVFGD